MSQPKLSLVFPCWHAAQHMQHVLEDLQAQTFKDFEAILVNDGDDSQVGAMEQIAAKDSRIRIVHREQNGGVAAARNSGTDAVTTPWVTYPDPDDRFGPNYARSLFEAVDGTGVEMACGGYHIFHVVTNEYSKSEIKAEQPMECVNIVCGYERICDARTQFVSWNKLYSVDLMIKNKLYQDIHFVNGQDYQFNMQYFPFVKRIGLVINCDYVNYEYDFGISNSTRYNPYYMSNRHDIINLCTQFHRQIGWSEQRVMEIRHNDLVWDIRKMFIILFYSNAHLTINEATAKLQADLFDQPENVAVIKQGKFGNNRMLQLIKILTRIGSARLATLTFKMLALFMKPTR